MPRRIAARVPALCERSADSALTSRAAALPFTRRPPRRFLGRACLSGVAPSAEPSGHSDNIDRSSITIWRHPHVFGRPGAVLTTFTRFSNVNLDTFGAVFMGRKPVNQELVEDSDSSSDSGVSGLIVNNERQGEGCMSMRERTAFVADIFQDLQYGIRWLQRSPIFTAAVVLTLAVGIGANTAVFSFIDSLLLEKLTVPHPEQLFHVVRGHIGGTRGKF